MNVIQVIDELSDKNISLVRVAQIQSNYNFLQNKSKIVTASNKNKHSDVKIFKNSIRNFLIFSKIYEFLKKTKPDVVHIHGIWRPIHLIFILHSRFLNIPILLQPHGMLLDQALKSKSALSYILKLVSLILYRLLLPKKNSFIAVTEDEQKSILEYFPKARIFIIPNPFIINKVQVNKINKRFIFFGRYNSHKNLKELITAYIAADLGKNWSLDIYGIDDDNNYKKELINYVKVNNYQKSINFFKPVFDLKKKYKIIAGSWCNVLLSKSEVLSLSVLEAMSVGTKSLVNSQIYFPKWIKKNLHLSDLNISELVKNIQIVANKTIKKIKEEKKNLKKTFIKNYLFKDLINKYEICLKETANQNNDGNKVSVTSIGILSNFLNIIVVPLLMILSVFFSKNYLATEIGIGPGILLLLTQIFSANSRSLLIYNKRTNIFHQTISFRLILGFLLFCIMQSFFYIFGFNQDLLLILIGGFVYFSWIIEIILSFYEKNKSYVTIKFFIFINTVFYSFILLGFIYPSHVNLSFVFFIFLIFQIVFILYHCDKTIFKINNIYNYLSKNFRNLLPLISSFSNIFAVVIWRFSLLFLIGKELAGVFFASFAIASFPGTIFNNIVGQIVILNEWLYFYVKRNFKKIIMSYFVILFICFAITESIITNQEILKFIDITLISLIGTPFMLVSLYYRHLDLSVGKKFQRIIFKKDIFYGLVISPIILGFYYLGGVNYITYSYVLSTIISMLVYVRIFRNYK